ncbi:tetratricopeptide repeat protein [Lutibacter sp. TH_r2]|uniref:tetratricopeptide repeat protein n=1 Tax=Lutibacter sp. TH_r2 TaxID=3082083 RepID=UPI002955C1D0|nr:tetratricopeptide repeat protein [Lutibacter sp. TH_r2]MDV7186419.1 tetratricopeptide repeat protein [Lutibacter sp. TH_r2]
MKKLVVVLAMFLSLVSFSQETEKLFSEGNTFYKTEDYSRAVDVYLSIEEQGFESADLYFNIGNCYYKMNKVAPSIYYYEKALKLDPNYSDAQFNLAFAQRMSIDAIEQLPKTFLQRFQENVILKFTYETWAIIAVSASFLMAILFLMYYFSGGTKTKLAFFNTAILAFFVLLITVFFAYQNYGVTKKDRPAIIFAEATEIKNAPTPSGEEVFELHEGTKVQILDELDDWKKIKLTDGKIGWIPSKDLKEI